MMNQPHFGPEAWEPLARGWDAYHRGDREAVLTVHSDVGGREEMPVSLFFRGRGELMGPDQTALEGAKGRVLDGGAGVGAMALLLQEEGVPVTALEVVPRGAEIMRARGVTKVREGRLEDLSPEEAFDTVLLLMNGTALAGTLAGLPRLLATVDRLLSPGGRLLMDSTDLGPYSELQYQLEFRGHRGAPFPQLFIGEENLATLAWEEGWATEVIWRGQEGEYLARLMRR